MNFGFDDWVFQLGGVSVDYTKNPLGMIPRRRVSTFTFCPRRATGSFGVRAACRRFGIRDANNCFSGSDSDHFPPNCNPRGSRSPIISF